MHEVTPSHETGREKSATLLQLVPTAGFLFYGVYCVVTQTAYVPATSYNDYRYTSMEGPHAIAFGVSLGLLAGCVGVAGRLWGISDNNRAAWVIRCIGIAIAVALGWYALLGGTHIY